MSKKQDAFYFENFIKSADCACQAANLLEKTMNAFSVDRLPDCLEKMHAIEHTADNYKHELLNVLAKAFITPIEREDIVQVSHNIDEMTDTIEDVLIRIYYNRLSIMRPDVLHLVQLVIRCCEEVQLLLQEFADFRRSKNLRNHIVKINSLEEEADKLYYDCMYHLHGSGNDLLDIIAWREIYSYLEKCADVSEHVADVVESVIMKNS